ncbi:MAG: hypothetical protein ACRDPO_18980 [Streptosporangiaceae bacterium]
MNPTPDTAAAGNGGRFDPRQAAARLDQTTWQARRTFASGQPLLWMFRAVVALVAFGGFWLSVRGHQDPYSGPSGWAVPVAFVFVAINIVWSTVAIRRAGAGVTGRPSAGSKPGSAPCWWPGSPRTRSRRRCTTAQPTRSGDCIRPARR